MMTKAEVLEAFDKVTAEVQKNLGENYQTFYYEVVIHSPADIRWSYATRSYPEKINAIDPETSTAEEIFNYIANSFQNTFSDRDAFGCYRNGELLQTLEATKAMWIEHANDNDKFSSITFEWDSGPKLYGTIQPSVPAQSIEVTLEI